MPADSTSGVVWTREMNERLMARQRRAMRKGIWVFVAGTSTLAVALGQVVLGGLARPLVALALVLGLAFLMEWRLERKVEPPVAEGVVVRTAFDDTGMEFHTSDGHHVRTLWEEVDHIEHDARTRLTHWKLKADGPAVFMPEEVVPADEVRAAQSRIARH